MKKKTFRFGLGTLLAFLFAVPVTAQETIYVLQEVPSEIRGFTFNGASLNPLDINPDPSEDKIFYDAAGWKLAATDNWFVIGVAQNGAGTSIVDASGIVLPPATTTVSGGLAAIVSADGRFALNVTQGIGVAFLGVVDIDPTSSTFLTEVATLDLQVGGAGESRAAVLSADGSTLYVAVDRFGPGSAIKIHAIDVSDPANLDLTDILSTTDVAPSPTISWDPLVASLRRYDVGGRDYLLVSRANLQVLEITAPDTLVEVLNQESAHPTFGVLRTMEDAWAFHDGTTDWAVATASSCEWNGVDDCLPTGEQEIVVVDLTPPGHFGEVDQITRVHRILSPAGEAGTAAPGDEYKVEWQNGIEIRPSLDGQTAYVLSNNPDPGEGPRGRLMAFDVDEVLDLAGTGTPAEPKGGSLYTDVLAFDMLIRDELTPVSGPPVITTAELDPSEGGGMAVQNDAARALDVTGSSLGGVTQAFLGPALITIDGVSATSADLTVPALTPTGNPTLGLVASNRAVGTFEGLAVVPPADFLPEAVAYAANNDGSVSVLNASTSSTVNPTFPSIFALNDMAISPDGRYLMVTSFRFNEIGFHCIVLDATTQAGGCIDWNELQFSANTSGIVAAEVATKPDGSRAYVNTIIPTADIVDMTTSPPMILGSIEVSAPGVGTFLTRGIDATATHLYLGADGRDFSGIHSNPNVIAIDIGDDVVDPGTEIFPISIPALAGVVGRGDGVRAHPDGSRLYYVMAGDPHMWILDIGSSPTAPPIIQGPAFATFPPGEVVNMTILPDGRFLYAAGRSSGLTEIYDLTNKDAPLLVSSISTGQVSNILRAGPNSNYVYVPVASTGGVAVIDARPGSPTLHQILTVAGAGPGASSVAITAGLETATGTNVALEPIEGAEITFDNITSSGTTTVTAANVAEVPPPANFEIVGLGVFYDVTTTATFSGNITLCFDYDDTGLTPVEEANLALLHEETTDGSKCDPPGTVPCWDDVTAPGSPDTGANEICGVVSELSLFVAAIQRDTAPPVVIASLDRFGGGDEEDDDSDEDSDEGRFVVDYSATDDFDPSPVCTANLVASGCGSFATSVGQIVEFEYDDEECEAETEDGILEIEGPGLTLDVSCTDAAGRTGTAQAAPSGLSGDNDSEEDLDD